MNQNDTIRVLQVGMSPYYGGTESFLMNQYRELDHSVVQFDFLNVYNEKIACEDEIMQLGGHIYHLDMARHHGLQAYYRNLDSFFLENASKFDVVHCNFQSLINTDILKYAKKYGIKVRIAHAHNSGYGTEPSIKQKGLIAFNKYTLHRYATQYFACSSLAAKWMFGHEATIIKNAIHTDNFVYSGEVRKRVRAQLGLNDSFTVIFVGRLDPQKNPVFMLEIFSEVRKKTPDAKLIVVGDGVLRNSMEQKIEALGLSPAVQMLGSRSDVNELLQAADAFLLPSKFEGLGIVLIEAQAAGLPTFTSADVVPEDVRITNLLHFIPLTQSATCWAKMITNGNTDRRQMKSEICQAGYDNHQNAKNLESLYVAFAQKSVKGE